MKTVDLAPEDALRLNVLLAGEIHAVRIDEGAMTLHALTPKGEAKISLHRNCRADLYVMRVRELLGGHALDSPGGYPVHLRRWTRMGHASPKNLAALLKLGEPEAVTAVALAPTLSDELARCHAPCGQSFLAAAELVLEKPPAHETVYLMLDILGNYFAPLREFETPAGLPAELDREIEAMAALSRVSNEAAMPILTRTSAIGPLMRRHLEPLFAPLIGHIRVLRGIAQ